MKIYNFFLYERINKDNNGIVYDSCIWSPVVLEQRNETDTVLDNVMDGVELGRKNSEDCHTTRCIPSSLQSRNHRQT